MKHLLLETIDCSQTQVFLVSIIGLSYHFIILKLGQPVICYFSYNHQPVFMMNTSKSEALSVEDSNFVECQLCCFNFYFFIVPKHSPFAQIRIFYFKIQKFYLHIICTASPYISCYLTLATYSTP